MRGRRRGDRTIAVVAVLLLVPLSVAVSDPFVVPPAGVGTPPIALPFAPPPPPPPRVVEGVNFLYWIHLQFNENLSAAPLPPVSDFEVVVNANDGRQIQALTVLEALGLNDTLELTLTRPLASGDAVSVSYRPTDPPLVTVNGTRVPGFENRGVPTTDGPHRMPDFGYGAAAARPESQAYIFGGKYDQLDAPSDMIWRYQDDGQLVTMPTRLPEAMVYATAIVDPIVSDACPLRCILIMGGRTSHDFSSGDPITAIYRYEPLSGTVTKMAAELPAFRFRSTIVWAGGEIAVLTEAAIDEVQGTAAETRLHFYDPRTDTVRDTMWRFDTVRGNLQAAWAPTIDQVCPETCVYLFGGFTRGELVDAGSGTVADQVRRYDIARNLFAPMTATLPGELMTVPSVNANEGFYFLTAGTCPRACAAYDSIAFFDPQADAFTLYPTTFPTTPVRNAPAVLMENDVAVIGGLALPGGGQVRAIQRVPLPS